MRGDDLLPSAARQWHVQRALGLPHPRWAHVPLVRDEAGGRLAKRSDALSLEALRARGADPRSIVGWAAETAGVVGPRRVTAAEVVPGFRLDEVPRVPVTVTDELVDRLIRPASA